MEYGACFNIWLKRPLTKQEMALLKKYEIYLMQYKGYSFSHDFKVPFITKYEKNQLLNTIGYIPEEEIHICGLATPLFRSIEAILKYFGGYAKIGVGDKDRENPEIKGVCHEIRKTNLYYFHLKYPSYQLIDWKLVANVYNMDATDEIKAIYSMQSFFNRAQVMNRKDDIKIVDEDYEIMKSKINSLIFIKGVAIYYDSTATERRIKNGSRTICKNNYSIVTDDGFFLVDKSRMLMDRFYNKIEINEYGLLKVTKKDNWSDSPDKFHYTTYIYDYDGNYLREYDFKDVITILSNRNKCFSPIDFIKMPRALEEGKFWENALEWYDIDFGHESEDGLTYTEEEMVKCRGYWQYVNDKLDNKMSLNDFYKGMLMLKNGRNYLNDLCLHYLEYCTNASKKSD